MLQPGERVVVVNNLEGFRFRYGFGHTIAGEFSDGKFDNGGEQVVLATGGGQTIVNFIYDDLWHAATDGGGQTLVIIDPAASLDVDPVTGQSAAWSTRASWRASTNPYGSPGIDDPAAGQSAAGHPTGVDRHVAICGRRLAELDRRIDRRKRLQDRAPHRHRRRMEQVAEVAGRCSQTYLDHESDQPATQYFYRVRAFNAAGAIAGTDPVSVTTQAPPLPAAPSNLTARFAVPRADRSGMDRQLDRGNPVHGRAKAGAAGGLWCEVGTLGVNVDHVSDHGLAPRHDVLLPREGEQRRRQQRL